MDHTHDLLPHERRQRIEARLRALADLLSGDPDETPGRLVLAGLGGLPVTGWSREHGDLRVAHFMGLHAIQVLALVAIGLRGWRRSDRVRVKAVLAAAARYASLFLLLLWGALRGPSVIAPDVMTMTALAALTALAVGVDRAWRA